MKPSKLSQEDNKESCEGHEQEDLHSVEADPANREWGKERKGNDLLYSGMCDRSPLQSRLNSGRGSIEATE